jgi:uncharacterized protein (TIGR02646 family)
MKYIQKPKCEPTFFSKWKQENKISDQSLWDDIDGTKNKAIKQKLKNELLKEQGWICCYCEQSLENQDSHIEHFKPRVSYKEECFNYRNLLCSCGSGSPPSKPKHCGHKKENHEIAISPLRPTCESKFKFSYDGSIAPNDRDASIEETIFYLGLNDAKLKELRKAAINYFLDVFSSEKERRAEAKKYLKKQGDRFNEFWTTIKYLFDK